MYTHTSFATRYFSHNVNKFCRIVVYIYIYIVFKNNSLLLKKITSFFFCCIKTIQFWYNESLYRRTYTQKRLLRNKEKSRGDKNSLRVLRGLYYFSRGDKNSSKAIANLQRYTLSGPVNTLQTAYIYIIRSSKNEYILPCIIDKSV